MHEEKDHKQVPTEGSSELTSNSVNEPAANSTSVETSPPKPKSSRNFGVMFLLVLLILSVTALFFVFYKNNQLQETVGLQNSLLSEAERVLGEVEKNKANLSTRVEEQLKQIESRMNGVESTNQELEGQKKTLQEEVNRFSKVDRLQFLMHIEQTLVLAAQQLKNSGNTQNMAITLDFLLVSLQARNSAELQPLVQALEIDKAAILAHPVVNQPETNAKIELLIEQVHTLPLMRVEDEQVSLIPQQAASPVSTPSVTATEPEATDSRSWWQQALDWSGDFAGTLYEESKSVVVIRDRTEVDNRLKAPVIRLQLENRLLQSQFALLARNQKIWERSLQSAQSLIEQNFLLSDKSVQGYLESLKALTNTPADYTGPNVDGALQAVRLLSQTIRSASE